MVTSARTAGQWRPGTDGTVLLGLVAIALFAVHPYLGDRLVGAADSYFYGLQAADAITQVRRGIMPLFIGQSDYAFNGNGHTLRTAPYFSHLAGLLDQLTLRRLSFVAVQNLCVAVTAVLTVGSAYLSCLLVSGGRRTAAALLAALYVLSPATLGPLVLHDMFATYMSIPWLVAGWAGIAFVLRRDSGLVPQITTLGALALTWYAHPPVAAWLSLAWLAAQVIRGVRADLRHLGHVSIAVLLLGLLAGYALVSGMTVGTGQFIAGNPPDFSFTPDRLIQAMCSGFTPFLLSRGTAGLQLGWALWAAVLFAAVLGIRHRITSGQPLLVLLALLIVCLFPLPALTGPLWRALPDRLVELTNWPEQRLYPLLASGAVIACAAAVRTVARRVLYCGLCAVLGVGLAWSLAEATALNHRPGFPALAPAGYAASYHPDNLVLTRYSYTLSPQLPASFSHSWTDPEFVSRLLDANLDPLIDNARRTLGSGPAPTLEAIDGRKVIDLPGPGEYLMVFAFQQAEIEGEITIRGPGLARTYRLPRSGEPEAFGSLPSCAKTIPLKLTRPGPQQITIGCTAPGVSFGVMPIPRNALPIQLLGQTPLTIRTRSPAAAFLETPRLYLDGYAATVNGRPAPARRSPDNLVMVPVPASDAEVVLTYPGSLLLRTAWVLSLAGFAAYPWLVRKALRIRSLPAPPPRLKTLAFRFQRLCRQHPLSVCLGLGLVLVSAGLFWFARDIVREQRAHGAIRLVLELPKHPRAKAEPLLTLGRTGAADCVYVIYEEAHHIRVGYDHWGYGGPVSPPIPVARGAEQVVEIVAEGLQRPGGYAEIREDRPVHAPETARFEVRLNGHPVISAHLPFYRTTADGITVGRNHAGNSVASAAFSGRILAQERFAPDLDTSGH